MLLNQMLEFTIHGKKNKKVKIIIIVIIIIIIIIIDLKYQLQHGIKGLNYLMNHILYQIFKIILSIPSKT